MNTEMDVVIAGLIGFVIGAVLMAIIGRGSKGKRDEETAKLQAEYDSYREKVNAHFAKTADAVDGLTKSYQQVFDHLSDGAQNLMDKKALQDQLDKRQGKAVTLAYLVDQEDASDAKAAGNAKVSKVSSSSVVNDDKQTKEPMVKKEAPVPAEEKADVIAHANTVKTPADAAKPAAKADAGKPEIAKPEATKAIDGKSTLNASPKADSASGVDQKPVTDKKPVIDQKNATVKAPVKPANDGAKAVDVKDKGSIQQAANHTDLKPAETIVKSNHHESAIDSVKKHIKDDDKGTKA